MSAEEKKTDKNEVTPEGAVEIQEEDLEQASGGAAYLKLPVDPQYKVTSPTLNTSLKYTPPPQDTLKKI